MQSALHMAVLLAVIYSRPARIGADAPSPADIKWQPPVIQAPALPSQPTVLGEMISRVRIATEFVLLKENTMTEVQSRLGGSLGHRGGAGDSLAWLCYYGADKDGRWALWLESSEIAGGAVDGFILQRLDRDARMDRRCGNLRSGKIELPAALKLGMTETEVRQSLGKPTLKFRSTLVFQNAQHETPRTGPSTVYVVLRKGVVWAIQVDKDPTS